jgi:polysaccharide export outer membrane protein
MRPDTCLNSRLPPALSSIAGWVLALVVLAICATITLTAQIGDYIIGPQDIVAVTVWDQADLAGKFAVDSDGGFTFPLIGRVKAGGLTLPQLEAELRSRLAAGYFRNPQVTVAVEQYRSQRIFVVGEVRTPGTYALTGNMSLIEALARAGSTLPTAGDEALIVRPAAGHGVDGPIVPETTSSDQIPATTQVIRVDIRELQSGIFVGNNSLRDGDTIFVPRAQTIFVFGQVKTPGEYAVKKETTVLQALSLAGGVTDRGSTGRIKIVRVVDGKKVEVSVKLNDVVQAGDTIVVQERFF